MSKGKREPAEKRFWDKVQKTNNCWLWTAATSKGYGRLGVNGKMVQAPRFSWELAYGPIPDGFDVCHHCDNPPCVRPDHLFLGTAHDNIQDCVKKRRARYGGSKLTEVQVGEIRQLSQQGMAQTKIAERYGITQGTVWFVIKRLTWRELL